MGMRNLRIGLWIAVAALAIGSLIAVFLPRPEPESTFGVAQFDLVDQTGAPVDETVFDGHPSLLFFGFTHCPDVCPTTLAEISSWFEALGDEGKDLQAYFVSVDPERDTPAILGDYVSWAGERVTGITGEPAEVAKLAKAWGAFYEKSPLDNGDYTMNHTASVFLLDSKGGFQGTIAYGEGATSALGKLRNLLAKS